MSLLQDVRFAVRLLVKDRWFTAVVMLTLALGIGMNAAMFTLVNGMLIRGLPFDESDRLMYAGERDVMSNRNFGVSWLDFQGWRDSQKSFSGLAAWSAATMNVSDAGRPPERYNGAYFTANGFSVLRVRPVAGRDFTSEDDKPGANPVVMLGYGIWKNRYNLDPMVLGQVIRVNEVTATIVGVMPEHMKFPDVDIWMTLSGDPAFAQQTRDQRTRLQAFGRLAPGVTRQQAQSEMSAVARRLERDYPVNANIGVVVMTFNERVSGGAIRLALLAAMGAVGFVLLIACANVANLLLARSTQRAKEIAIRISIGATRGRIVRQLLVESVLLSAASGVFGLLLAVVGTRWFDVVTREAGRPFFIQFVMDARVLAFFAAVCLMTGILFGLAPALRASRPELQADVIRSRRWTGAMIAGELALTLVLLSGAGFMMRSFLTLYRIDLGIDTSALLTLNMTLPERKYPTPEARAAFYQRLDERLSANRTIRFGTMTSNVPLGGAAQVRLMAMDGTPQVSRVTAGPRYFETLGLPLTRGRAFIEGDSDAGIVNQRFVTLHFPNADPIGQRIQLDGDSLTIVGVVPSVRQRNLREPDPDPVVYVPYRFAPVPSMALLIRTSGESAASANAIREEVRAIDPDLPLFGIVTMDQHLVQVRLLYRVFGTMFASFGAVALLLSTLGLYGVTAYSVTQRTHEIGVRMALGADSKQVSWLFVRRTLLQLSLGLTVGMAGAFAVGRLLQSLLATSPTDPLTLVSVAGVFLVVSLAACYVPAQRATLVDPIRALRHD